MLAVSCEYEFLSDDDRTKVTNRNELKRKHFLKALFII